MSKGFRVKLPLTIDKDNGLALNKNLEDVVKQNLKNLLLTAPGERIMIPDFGVGLKAYLFENDTMSLRSEISAKIHEQISKYMSYISIISIDFKSSRDNKAIPDNILHLRLNYRIDTLDKIDVLDIDMNLSS